MPLRYLTAPAIWHMGWSQGRHNPQRAVHAQLVGAVITTPGLRRTANAGGEPGAVPFHLHGVAAEGGTERPVTLCHNGMPLKRRRLVVLGPAVFGIEGVQVGVLHVHLHRSEEHTSELQSPCNLVCRLLL